MDESRVEVRVKTAISEPRRFFEVSASGTLRKQSLVETTIYETRGRPWYKQAPEKRRSIWAPVYIDYRGGDLVTTHARPVLNEQRDIEGVVATDVSLKKLSEFMGRFKLTKNGVAFIVDAAGNLIATSTGEPLYRPDGSIKKPVLAVESTNELVRATYAQFVGLPQKNSAPEMPYTTHFKTSEGVVGASFNAIRDDAGLNLFTIIAAARGDFTAGLSGSLMRAILWGWQPLVSRSCSVVDIELCRSRFETFDGRNQTNQ